MKPIASTYGVLTYELRTKENVPADLSRASVLRARAGTEALLAIT